MSPVSASSCIGTLCGWRTARLVRSVLLVQDGKGSGAPTLQRAVRPRSGGLTPPHPAVARVRRDQVVGVEDGVEVRLAERVPLVRDRAAEPTRGLGQRDAAREQAEDQDARQRQPDPARLGWGDARSLLDAEQRPPGKDQDDERDHQHDREQRAVGLAGAQRLPDRGQRVRGEGDHERRCGPQQAQGDHAERAQARARQHREHDQRRPPARAPRRASTSARSR